MWHLDKPQTLVLAHPCLGPVFSFYHQGIKCILILLNMLSIFFNYKHSTCSLKNIRKRI